jgi:hypothetical protein
MKLWKTWVLLTALAAASGCGSDQKKADGPVENAGEAVDEAASDTKDAAKEAGDSVEETADDATDGK